ncbi:MAG: IS110 family transposase [Bdellovibrionales bacterium]
MRNNLVAIDLAKKVCQIHMLTSSGEVKKKVKTNKLLEFLVNIPEATIAMEACGSSNHWARKVTELGHTPKLIPPQFVKPFLIGNKNDSNDARAIFVAAQQKHIRSVPHKSLRQQEINMIHNVRSGLIRSRTKVINQIRGYLRELGIKTEASKYRLATQVALVCEDADNALGYDTRWLLSELRADWVRFDERVKSCEERLKVFAKENEAVVRLMEIPGVGLITATCIVCSYGDLKQFKQGRNFAAWVGLVPSHSGTGGKNQNMKLTKRCDVYLRQMMIHGARSVLALAVNGVGHQAKRWAELEARVGFNKACVAIANRNARTAWALIVKNEEYKK